VASDDAPVQHDAELSAQDSERATTVPRLAGRAPRLGILMIASEVAPWAKTGGLADVTGALPAALDRLGHRITLVMPRYRSIPISDASTSTRSLRVGTAVHDVTFHVVSLSARRRLVMVDAPRLFGRDGYYGLDGRDFDDNAERFGVFSVAALDFAEHDVIEPSWDVVHAHDWQTGLAPTLLKVDPGRYHRLRQAGTVFTIHNLAYQGLFPREVVPGLGLPWNAFTLETGEFYGKFSFLKAGLVYSDYLTTVSPAYARETQDARFGAGLEGVLFARRHRYVGILNGIDTETWDPASDRYVPAHFDAEHLGGKAVCKRALLERFGLSVGDDALGRPVVGLVSRLVEQKGLHLIQEAADALVALDATWVFLGTGEARFERFLRDLAARFPLRVATHIGFDERLAHLVEAGADMFLMPSTFEPCGLNQMYSLRYGTVPIVTAVGGLDDTVQPYTARASGANGFKFREPSADALVRTVRQAVRLFHDKSVWVPLMKQGMAADHSWETPAREYVKVYRRARQAAAFRVAG
jgi:starch synthase